LYIALLYRHHPTQIRISLAPLSPLKTMNSAQLKSLAVFSLFAIIGFGPISPGCLIGMYIVTMRPAWFLALTENMYRDKALNVITYIKNPRIKAFLSLFSLFLIDIAPVPVTPVIAFGIILVRPLWFYRVVVSVYSHLD
jgi:hypothetical protein